MGGPQRDVTMHKERAGAPKDQASSGKHSSTDDGGAQRRPLVLPPSSTEATDFKSKTVGPQYRAVRQALD